MDALEKLKNDWKKDSGNYPKFSEQEIYAMLHRRSSSIVKWILIISVIEFAFWLGLSLLLRDTPQNQKMNSFHAGYILTPLEIAYYAMIAVFVFIFYRNFRNIKVTDSARTLMQRILKTKRAVTYYIIAMLAYNFISFIVVFVLYFLYEPQLLEMIHTSEENGNVGWFYCLYIGITLLVTAFILWLFWLVYRFIYGRLLKRLHRNYEELKKLDF